MDFTYVKNMTEGREGEGREGDQARFLCGLTQIQHSPSGFNFFRKCLIVQSIFFMFTISYEPIYGIYIFY